MVKENYLHIEAYLGNTDKDARDFHYSLANDCLYEHLRRSGKESDIHDMITYYSSKHYICEHDAHKNENASERILKRMRKKAHSALLMLDQLEEIEFDEFIKLRKTKK